MRRPLLHPFEGPLRVTAQTCDPRLADRVERLQPPVAPLVSGRDVRPLLGGGRQVDPRFKSAPGTLASHPAVRVPCVAWREPTSISRLPERVTPAACPMGGELRHLRRSPGVRVSGSRWAGESRSASRAEVTLRPIQGVVAAPRSGGRFAAEHLVPGGEAVPGLPDSWRRAGVSPSPRNPCPLDWHAQGYRLSLQRAQPAKRSRPALSGRDRFVSIGCLCPRVEGPLFRPSTVWVVLRWIRLARNTGSLGDGPPDLKALRGADRVRLRITPSCEMLQAQTHRGKGGPSLDPIERAHQGAGPS